MKKLKVKKLRLYVEHEFDKDEVTVRLLFEGAKFSRTWKRETRGVWRANGGEDWFDMVPALDEKAVEALERYEDALRDLADVLQDMEDGS